VTMVSVLQFVECDFVMFGRQVTTLPDFLSSGHLKHGFSRFASICWYLSATFYSVTSQVFRKWDGEVWSGLIWLRTGTVSWETLNAVMNIRFP
jgi:hypothetical protein